MRHPRYRLRNRARFMFAIVLVLGLLTGGGLFAAGYYSGYLYDWGIVETLPGDSDDYKDVRLNVLAMGIDARKGEKMARADTMMLISLDTEKNLVSILSIPRDTRVRVPGRGWEKINSTTLFGGPTLAMKTVSDLLGIRVDKYVMTNYEGFKDIVDALGGVTIDVKQRMYHYDPQDGEEYTIDLYPGVQRLDGDKALQFVRYRDYVMGDINRAEQQQKFLAALVDEALQPSTVFNLPSLAVSLNKAVDTNLSIAEMRRLAQAAAKMDSANLVTQTLPGVFLNTDDGSYWEVDPGQARQVVARLFEGKSVDKVVMGETTTMTSMYKPVSDGQQDSGGVVPGGQPARQDPTPGGEVNSNTTTRKAQGSTVKTGGGSSSQQSPATTVKTPGSSGTSRPPGAVGQPGGVVVPGATDDEDKSKKNPEVEVIIESKTPEKQN